jgi:radial spoke head protein 4A
MARKVKVIITGDLEKKIYTNPPFEGTEKNYLRAQIARISHSTALYPKGLYKVDEENDREILEEVTEDDE